VQPPGSPPRDDERVQLEALRRLASVLGASFLVEEGDDLVTTVAQVAAERGTTYVLIGQPQPRTGLRRLGESLPDRLLRMVPGVDVRIVADRSRRLDVAAGRKGPAP
jgi:two-component system, OmpR family, sensor histidine kinase KdpD